MTGNRATRLVDRPPLPVNKEMCGTCPFREGSPYGYLQGTLVASALTEASRICHSTGRSVIYKKTSKPSVICRGARDRQLNYLARIGFLREASDAAWDEKWRELSGAGKVE